MYSSNDNAAVRFGNWSVDEAVLRHLPSGTCIRRDGLGRVVDEAGGRRLYWLTEMAAADPSLAACGFREAFLFALETSEAATAALDIDVVERSLRAFDAAMRAEADYEVVEHQRWLDEGGPATPLSVSERALEQAYGALHGCAGALS
jgi:hypothetical protein